MRGVIVGARNSSSRLVPVASAISWYARGQPALVPQDGGQLGLLAIVAQFLEAEPNIAVGVPCGDRVF